MASSFLALSAKRSELVRWVLGIALSAALAASANVAGQVIQAPVMLLVLLMGIGMRASLPRLVEAGEPGIIFCARTVLRSGVAMLGLRIVGRDLLALGPKAIVLVLGSVAITITLGYLLAIVFRRPKDLAAISATSVAICGASAALAASAVVPRRFRLEEDTAMVIIVVSLLSTAVMILYPWLAAALDLDTRATALMLGASIHDVAQVAGAGFAVSPEVGRQAVAVKMVRVACLVPVVALVGTMFRRDEVDNTNASHGLIPPFLIGFLILALAASTGVVPKALAAAGGQAAGWALTTAVAAIGLKTHLRDLRRADPALVLLMITQTLVQLTIVLALLHLLVS